MKLQFAGISDIGDRQNNEDAYTIREIEGSYLFAVADGLGAHEGSEFASKFLCDALADFMPDFQIHLDREFIPPVGKGAEKNESYLSENVAKIHTLMVQWINNAVAKMQEGLQENKKIAAMTTLAMVYVNDYYTAFAHLGDSRAYRFKNHSPHIVWQSRDHSLVQELIDSGSISATEATTHPYRNVLAKCYGFRSNPAPSINVQTLLTRNEGVLVCSDGFWENLNEKAIQALFKAKDIESCLKKLIAEWKKTSDGNLDNITAVFARS